MINDPTKDLPAMLGLGAFALLVGAWVLLTWIADRRARRHEPQPPVSDPGAVA